MNAVDPVLPKVLVVEDDPTIQLIVRRSLEKRFSVSAYTNGIDALSFLQEGNLPDIIIADLNTPEMGGLELIEQLKASGYFSAIPVLVLSGEESTESRIKCLDSGADDYVVKPFNPRELEARINAILRRTGKILLN
ncbi:two-component system response regulator [Flavipsychrobacter stenotrophus]|uniref:Two-component system response regulator n=1 Tax=Flavipsychrobacter stenotrophus TaxID=2077091 RepID=A0A2S7T250_9BACT|nr:response regulator transcription factor [Flavipsychrobacter stenotrophus]PQJ13034.1 two-component system response regulator [Flavipsychrobacter stenotrophus]